MTAAQLQPPTAPSPTAPPPAGQPQSLHLGWRLLRLLNIYRMALAVLLAIIAAFGSSSAGGTASLPTLGSVSPTTFTLLCGIYVAVAAILGSLLRSRSLPINQQALAHVFSDTLIICLLSAASGGVRSGLGVLLLFTLGTCGMVMSQRTTLASAAGIALSVIVTELLIGSIENSSAALPQTGILGAALFGIALMTPRLARRVNDLESLVNRSSKDIARLQQLNNEVVRQLSDGIVAVDENDRIELCNEAALSLLRAKPPKFGSSLSQLNPLLAQQLTLWRAGKSSPAAASQRYRTTIRMVDARQRQGSVVLILQNLSELNEQIHQTKLAAMGRLTASIAHEIRNPLSAIKQAGQLLQETQQTAGNAKENKRLLDMVQRHSNRINAIVESVMQLSSSRLPALETLNLSREVRAAIAEQAEGSQLSKRQVVVNIPEPMHITFDQGQLRQILSNLLSNAAKHAKPTTGEVRVIITGRHAQERQRAELAVSDNGPGLASDDHEQYFEPFHTTGNGSGLGLFICRQLAQANGAALNYQNGEFVLYFDAAQRPHS